MSCPLLPSTSPDNLAPGECPKQQQQPPQSHPQIVATGSSTHPTSMSPPITLPSPSPTSQSPPPSTPSLSTSPDPDPTMPTPLPASFGDSIAGAAHDTFTSLPKHGKPQVRSNGIPEWTVLACIALVVPLQLLPVVQTNDIDLNDHSSAPDHTPTPPIDPPSTNTTPPASSPTLSSHASLPSTQSSGPRSKGSKRSKQPPAPPLPPRPRTYTPDGRVIIPISIGTGVKCLPSSRLPPAGDTLHDSHAEVIARRSFVSWLLWEAKDILRGHQGMGVMEWNEGKFCLKEGVEVVLYVSVLPCGDASTLYLAAHQSAEMAAFKANGVSSILSAMPGSAIRGRLGYENYGAIRTKPGRAMSIPTTSFSCSDKIASWCALGLQGGLLEPLFEPIYLEHIIIGGIEEDSPETVREQVPHGKWRERIRKEVERALWGRLSGIDDRLPAPYSLHKPMIHLSTVPFGWSKESIAESSSMEPVPSMVSLAQVLPTGLAGEVIVNGSRQNGVWKAPGRTPITESMRTRLSKLELMRSFIGTWELAFPDEPLGDVTYHELKHPSTSIYQAAKAILRGTPRYMVPETFNLAFPQTCLTTAGSGENGDHPPFRGWIVVGRAYECFLKDGTSMLTEEDLKPRLVEENRRTRDLKEVMEVIASIGAEESPEALLSQAFNDATIDVA